MDTKLTTVAFEIGIPFGRQVEIHTTWTMRKPKKNKQVLKEGYEEALDPAVAYELHGEYSVEGATDSGKVALEIKDDSWGEAFGPEPEPEAKVDDDSGSGVSEDTTTETNSDTVPATTRLLEHVVQRKLVVRVDAPTTPDKMTAEDWLRENDPKRKKKVSKDGKWKLKSFKNIPRAAGPTVQKRAHQHGMAVYWVSSDGKETEVTIPLRRVYTKEYDWEHDEVIRETRQYKAPQLPGAPPKQLPKPPGPKPEDGVRAKTGTERSRKSRSKKRAKLAKRKAKKLAKQLAKQKETKG